MRLRYSILWFDDSDVYFDSLDIDPLLAEVGSWGFQPEIRLVTTPEEFKKHAPFSHIDLLVVDRNLEGYEDGEVFIEQLRSHAVYTEVILYTAGEVSDLWDAVCDKHLEGVFVSDRIGLLPKIEVVGRQSIKKVLDFENMRGIVMAEVGELDQLLDKIVEAGVRSLSQEHQKAVFDRFSRAAKLQHEGVGARLVAFSEAPQIPAMLEFCDSDKRWQNLRRLWRYHASLRGRPKPGDFVAEVLRPRNFLAHGSAEYPVDGGCVFRYRGDEFSFNEEIGAELRRTILRYKDSFTEILNLLTA